MFFLSRTCASPFLDVLFTTPTCILPPFQNLVGAYCVFIINTLVSIGLLLIHVKGYSAFDWDPPVRTPRSIVIAYFISNILLLVAPFTPPGEGRVVYENLPYWVSKRHAYAFCLEPVSLTCRCRFSPGSLMPLRRLAWRSLVWRIGTGSRCGILRRGATPFGSSL